MDRPIRLTRYNDLIAGTGELIDGRWEITGVGDLAFRRSGPDEEIFLRGPILAAEPGALTMSVEQKQKNQNPTSRRLRLSGFWDVDPKNRLRFSLESESGSGDRLVFEGRWETSKTNELLYRISPARGRSKARRTLSFGGHWDISSRHRIVYVMSGSSELGVSPELRFRGSFQTKSILAKKGEIRWQLGAEARSGAGTSIALFGKWKFSDKLGLFFETDTPQRKKRAITFGVDLSPARTTDLSVGLVARGGEPLGVKLLLTRSLKSGIDSFASFKKNTSDTRLEAGIRLTW